MSKSTCKFKKGEPPRFETPQENSNNENNPCFAFDFKLNVNNGAHELCSLTNHLDLVLWGQGRLPALLLAVGQADLSLTHLHANTSALSVMRERA